MAKITKKIDPFRDSGYTPDAAGKPAKIALNQGPSTPVKLYTDVNIPGKVGRFLPNSGAARPTGKTRPKKGKV